MKENMFLLRRVVEHRQRLSEEVVESPSLVTFKPCLAVVLGSQLQLTLP